MRYDVTGYLLKAWFTTIIVSPVVLGIWFTSGKDIGDGVELFFVMLVFGALLSLPVLIIAYLFAKLLSMYMKISILFKTILIVLILALTCLEFYIINGDIFNPMVYIYISANALCMLFYRINVIEEIEKQDVSNPLFGNSE